MFTKLLLSLALTSPFMSCSPAFATLQKVKLIDQIPTTPFKAENIEKLHSGMTYSEVAKMLGRDGTLADPTTITRDAFKMFVWWNEIDMVTVAFDQDDHARFIDHSAVGMRTRIR